MHDVQREKGGGKTVLSSEFVVSGSLRQILSLASNVLQKTNKNPKVNAASEKKVT